jgi:hypothetical protein
VTFDEAVEATGWNAESQVEVLLDYIRMSELFKDIGAPLSFEDYLTNRVKDELGDV